MSIQIVNGYACLNCSDVAEARRGVDPAQGPDGEAKAVRKPAAAEAPPPSPDPGRGRTLDLQA